MSEAPSTEPAASTPPPPEIQANAPANQQGTVTKEDARAALELIAHPNIDRILTDASQLYLDRGDPRLLLTALAGQTAGTALGDELRRDTLEMIARTDFTKEIADLGLPKTDPGSSQFLTFIERYNKNNPGRQVSAELVSAIRSGNIESAPLVAEALRSDTGLSQALWTELAGDKPRPQLTTPDGLLGAAGLEKNDAHRARAEAMLTPLKTKKDWNVTLEDMVPSVLGGVMLLSFVTQLAMTDSGQSQGH